MLPQVHSGGFEQLEQAKLPKKPVRCSSPRAPNQIDDNSVLCSPDGAICDGSNMFLNGITYGPCSPCARDRGFPAEGQLGRDLVHIRSLGFNSIRVYESPTNTLLRIANEEGLTVMAGIAWAQHVELSGNKRARRHALAHVTEETARLATHTTIAGVIVGNEIETQLVRWMGADNAQSFLEELIAVGRSEAPNLPIGYASYPPTEYLIPRNATFVGFNVFLEQRSAFAAYVQHLQTLCGERPVIITEFGIDSTQHGERAQAAIMQWQRETLLNAGVAGGYWFSYTDDWYRGGQQVKNWNFGIVKDDRTLKAAAELAPHLPRNWAGCRRLTSPMISAIVCTHNGSSTLRGCLEALCQQSYSACEVIVIDDDSTDATQEIVREFEKVRYYKQKHAGLAAARNHGMRMASGELLAYTDDDAMADADWLGRLVDAFEDSNTVAAGGPNLPPRPRNKTEQIISLAPGGPAHVLLNDYDAEHLPGCNLAIRKSALELIGGFRDQFRTAGDDVDVCWRLRAEGGNLRFVPGAVVWHHRRNSVAGYLRQQRGYGLAEAQLIARFPSRFSWLGGASWDGAIYGVRSSPEFDEIKCGRHGMAQFQCIYPTQPNSFLHYFLGLPSLMFAVSFLGLGFAPCPICPLGISVAILLGGAVAAWYEAAQRLKSQIAPSLHDRLLLWALCWLQPIVRDAARSWGIVANQAWPTGKNHFGWNLTALRKLRHLRFCHKLSFWHEEGQDRSCLLATMERTAPSQGVEWREAKAEAVWDADLQVGYMPLSIITVTEYHGRGRTRTMIRLGLSYYPLAVGVCIAVAAAPVIGLRFGLPLEVICGYWFVLLLVSAVWTSVVLISVQQIYSLARAAAKDCGLVEIKNMPAMDQRAAGLDSSETEINE